MSEVLFFIPEDLSNHKKSPKKEDKKIDMYAVFFYKHCKYMDMLLA